MEEVTFQRRRKPRNKDSNKTVKAYCLVYTKISNVFFMPHHVGHSRTNVIPVHCCVLGHSCTNLIQGHCCILGHSWTNMSPSPFCTTVSSAVTLDCFLLQRPQVGLDPTSQVCSSALLVILILSN